MSNVITPRVFAHFVGGQLKCHTGIFRDEVASAAGVSPDSLFLVGIMAGPDSFTVLGKGFTTSVIDGNDLVETKYWQDSITGECLISTAHRAPRLTIDFHHKGCKWSPVAELPEGLTFCGHYPHPEAKTVNL